jgi:molybdopterin molybdotransferase
MIEVEQALSLIDAHATVLEVEHLAVDAALRGRVLAEAVPGPADLPSFRQSSMDGYALCYKTDASSYEVIGEVAAGSSEHYALSPGQAVRIFTGARVPKDCDRVIMQEQVSRTAGSIQLKADTREGQNVRAIGSQIRRDEIVLEAQTTLTPASIGLLASLGIASVSVIQRPRVAIVVTGNELVALGESKNEVQVYESNSLALQAALEGLGLEVAKVLYASDDPDQTVARLAEALQEADMVLISGGISVGDYDYVADALKGIEVESIFYTVRQKPGKPLFFGKKGEKAVFALPGNPASTLSCFYVYVKRYLERVQGIEVKDLELTLEAPIENRFGRALFVKAKRSGGSVTPIDEFNSATLMSFAKADALIYVPADTTRLEAQTAVKVISL